MLILNNKYTTLDRILNEKLSPKIAEDFYNWIKSTDELNDNLIKDYKVSMKSISKYSDNKEIFTDRGIDKHAAKDFLKVLEENGYSLDEAIDKCNSVPFDALLNGTDISTVLEMNKNLCKELADIKNREVSVDGKSVDTGKFEVLLKFFLKGGRSPQDRAKGDVECDNGGILEVKAGDGPRPGDRLTGISVILKEVDSLLENSNADGVVRYKNHTVRDFIKDNEKHFKDIPDKVAKALATGVCVQYGVSDKQDILSTAAIKFLSQVNEVSVRQLIGCLQLAAYAFKSGFNYLVLFKNNDTLYKCFSLPEKGGSAINLLDFKNVSNSITFSHLNNSEGGAVVRMKLKK